jgi:hypothetical protein
MSAAVHDLLNKSSPDTLHIEGDFPLDENVIAGFPEGTKVLSAVRYGTSAWTITARINVELLDKTPARYFIKVAAEDRGRVMMEGEFNAMSELRGIGHHGEICLLTEKKRE